jgi:segregation and condensation protein A
MSEPGETTVEDGAAPAAAAVATAELELAHQVRLEHFSGPLDLLLYLVRRAEVDIAEVAVAEIADQYIAAVSSWSELDLESAGDFILMAATLLELKSRLVAPPLEDPAAEAAADDEAGLDVLDPRANLIRQLLTYRRFKEATQWLADLESAHLERIARQLREVIPEDPDELDGLSLDNCDAGALWSMWESVLIRINGLGPRTVINDDLPLETRIIALADQVRERRQARLGELLAAEPTKVGRVGILLATLECARQKLLEAEQHEQYGEVLLRWRESAPPTEPPAEDGEGAGEPARRRRRPPLVTFAAPDAGAGDDIDEGEEPEATLESDEQRFLRELEESCAVESVTARVADLEGSFATFLAARAAPAAEPAPAPDPAS